MSDWQELRMVSALEFQLMLSALGLSQAAAGRYLGRSARTIRRYLDGEATIPPAEVLLLQGLLQANLRPLVPPRPRR